MIQIKGFQDHDAHQLFISFRQRTVLHTGLAMMFADRDRIANRRDTGSPPQISKLPQFVIVSLALLEKFGSLKGGHLPPAHFVSILKSYELHGVSKRMSAISDY